MKRFTALFTALMLLFTAAAALADTKITVSGTGEIPVSADNAVVSLGVNIRESDVLTAQQEANRITAAIREALTALGIPQDCLNTDLLNVYVIYDYQGGDEKVSGYNASSTLAVKVTDMDKVGPSPEEGRCGREGQSGRPGGSLRAENHRDRGGHRGRHLQL